MDEAQKARIRLEHWINHNCEHLRGYLEVSNSLDTIGMTSIGDRIRNAVEYIDRANDEFRKALDQLTQVTPSTGCGRHEHSHDHGHSHEHEHCHDHGHCHNHEQCHGDSHSECHDHSHEHSHSHPHNHHDKSGHRHD